MGLKVKKKNGNNYASSHRILQSPRHRELLGSLANILCLVYSLFALNRLALRLCSALTPTSTYRIPLCGVIGLPRSPYPVTAHGFDDINNTIVIFHGLQPHVASHSSLGFPSLRSTAVTLNCSETTNTTYDRSGSTAQINPPLSPGEGFEILGLGCIFGCIC